MPVDQSLAQVIRPAAGQLHHLALERFDIDLVAAQLRGEEEVEAKLAFVFTHGQLVIDMAGLEFGRQIVLNSPPHLGIEPVAGHDDHHRQPPRQRVGTHGKAHPAFLRERHDGADLLMQLSRIDPEQLLAGHGVEYRHDLLVVVRVGQGVVDLEHLAQLAPQDRGLFDRGGQGFGGE